MSKKDGILHLILKYEWFDKIESGAKKIEYRDFKKWKRIQDFPYKFIRFYRGYVNPKEMIFEIKNISRQQNIDNDLKCSDVLAIELGKRIS